MAKLNQRQAAFVREYLIDLNATQAAIRAGYSKKTARQMGTENLSKPAIQEAIQNAIARREKRTNLKADAVLEELASIGFANMADYITWTGRSVTLKSSSQLDRDLTGVVSEISETPTRYGRSVKFKLHDKLRALEMLAKHLGIFEVSDRSDKTLLEQMHEAMTEEAGEYVGNRSE